MSPPSLHITVGHGYVLSTIRQSSGHTTQPTGSHSCVTRMSCRTSGGCRQHPLILSPPIGSFGKRNSHYPSTTPSGPNTTLANDGTVSAPSKPPMNPSTDQTTSTVSTHRSAASRTTPERTATPSPTTTRTSLMVAARARSTKALKIKWEHSF